ncbi:MAG: general secretion pathway protein GspM, partial [Lysobacter sp.]|nr:general secretion pathway protein GspM [Lysobacter sp.]
MAPATTDRDRWLALGLLVAALAIAYFVLLHPWWTVPMIDVESRIETLQERELRIRTQLAQAPDVEKRLVQVQAAQRGR